jgi:outer membrane protein assembly factor BamB
LPTSRPILIEYFHISSDRSFPWLNLATLNNEWAQPTEPITQAFAPVDKHADWQSQNRDCAAGCPRVWPAQTGDLDGQRQFFRGWNRLLISGDAVRVGGNAFGRLEDLDLINPTTGQMTPIGPMETVISDIVFAADGVLYGSSPDGMLYSISPATGMKTALFDTGILSISGLAAIVPEPSSFLLMALGSVLLLILLIRRARNSSTR